jgi:hypothetical protein
MINLILVADVAAIEIDHSTILVIERKDNAVIEYFVALLVEDAQLLQGLYDVFIIGQDVPKGTVDEANAEVFQALEIVDASFLEIVQALAVFTKGMLIIINHPGQQLSLFNCQLFTLFRLGSLILDGLRGCPGFQPAHCLLEPDMIKQFNKADGITALVATEAVPQVVVRVDAKGWVGVFMKGTRAFIAFAVLAEFDASGFDQGHQINAFFDSSDEFLIDHDSPLFRKKLNRSYTKT